MLPKKKRTLTLFKDYNADAFDTTTVFSVVAMAGASAYAIYHTFWIYLPSQPPGRKSVGRFNRLILAYLISTLIASFTFDLMNAGKIWASFGVLHNLFEIALLAGIFIRRSDVRQVFYRKRHKKKDVNSCIPMYIQRFLVCAYLLPLLARNGVCSDLVAMATGCPVLQVSR